MAESLDYILSAKAVRESTAKVWSFSQSGQGHFQIHQEKLPELADYVCEIIKENYPTLEIPYHSRWGHFDVGGVPRVQKFTEKLSNQDKLEVARCKFDLVIPSVLLDAGAGPNWKYIEAESGKTFSRSEGLAVASFHMFVQGAFSKNPTQALRCDAEALTQMKESILTKAFQVSEDNPLVGIPGRLELLNNLGHRILEQEEYFPEGRVGGLVDFLQKKYGNELAAENILRTLLLALGPIWPGRLTIDGVNIGDVWAMDTPRNKVIGLVAFHKLSQWLTYSLIEPLEEAGFTITGLKNLTGLAEYRNGGLFVDFGILSLKDPQLLEKAHNPGDALIIEWRALTICLLDELAPLVRERLNKHEEEFPLVKMLEGGTWRAGRVIAKKNRKDGSPPIKIESDGTVF